MKKGDRLILDDPHTYTGRITEEEKLAVRANALKWFNETLPKRLADAKDAPIVVIFSRLHEEDKPDES